MNNISFLENKNIEEIHLLSRSIESFNGAALKFETYYRHLEQRVRELNHELEIKNRELENNLKEKKEVKNYLRNILQSLTTGIIVVDLNGNITTFNRAAENITGLISEEIKGKNINNIMSGCLMPVLKVKLTSLNDLNQKNEFETEILYKEKNPVNVRVSNFPVKNPKGEKIGTAFNIQDITQLKKLEEKVTRTDRLAAMGEIAAEIAHEIRNPLGSIELFATTLKKDLEEFGDLKALAEHISAGVSSMNNIISNLLLFISPKKQFKFHRIDVLKPLNDSLKFSYDLIESNERKINVSTDFSVEPLFVLGDSDLLKQVWLNLLMNAVQAMPDGGKLSISAKKVRDPQTNSNFVEVQFGDTGEGMSGENMKKVFNPFFTTKKKGTGLGLAIVHNILEIHNGDIDIDSSKDEGTICRVKLPLHKGQDRV